MSTLDLRVPVRGSKIKASSSWVECWRQTASGWQPSLRATGEALNSSLRKETKLLTPFIKDHKGPNQHANVLQSSTKGSAEKEKEVNDLPFSGEGGAILNRIG